MSCRRRGREERGGVTYTDLTDSYGPFTLPKVRSNPRRRDTTLPLRYDPETSFATASSWTVLEASSVYVEALRFVLRTEVTGLNKGG